LQKNLGFDVGFGYHNNTSIYTLVLFVIIRLRSAKLRSCVYRTVRVWIKRNTGQYWPSICHTMPGKKN